MAADNRAVPKDSAPATFQLQCRWPCTAAADDDDHEGPGGEGVG